MSARYRGLAPVCSRLFAVVGVIVALVSGCKDDGVEDVEILAPSGYWAREGFVEMVPPVHLPSSSDDLDQVEVWIRVPDGAKIGARRGAEGEVLLRFPAGTVADRVEYAGFGQGRFVADVRGATVAEGDEQYFHAYRPIERAPDADLVGVRWKRGDASAHAKATERLLQRVRKTHPARTMKEGPLQELLDSVRKKNECLPCHAPGRPDNRVPNEHGLVNRGTDDSGFFTPSTVLRDVVVLETYGRFDRSLRDGAIVLECGGQPVEPDALIGRRCRDATVARGRWDPQRAGQIDPRRLEAICASRRYLLERLDPDASTLLGDVMQGCPGRAEP